MTISFVSLKRNDPHVKAKDLALVAHNDEPGAFIPAMVQTGARHVIQKTRDDFDICVKRTESFEDSPSFSLSRIYDVISCSHVNELDFEFEFKNLTEKELALQSLAKFVSGHSSLSLRARQIEAVAGELALNAILSSTAAYREMNGKDYVFTENRPCQLRLVADSHYAVVSCWDPVGSLRRQKMLARLHEIYTDPHRVRTSQTASQSGIGCKVIMDHSTDFFALCQANQETIVACRVPLKGSGSSIDQIPKCFHLVIYGEKES